MMYANGCRSNYNKCYDSYLILPTFLFLFFTLTDASIIPALLWNGSVLHISCLDNVHMGDLLNLFFSDLVIKSKGEKQIYINYIFDQYKNVFYIIQHDIFTLRTRLNQARPYGDAGWAIVYIIQMIIKGSLKKW
jgi:hypothetical protein